MTKRYKYSKALSLAVLSAMMVTGSVVTVDAAGITKTSAITGNVEADASVVGSRNVKDKGDSIDYTVYGITITPSDNSAPITLKGTKPINITARGALILQPKESSRANGISMGDNEKLNITMLNGSTRSINPLTIIAHSTGYSANGISIAREGTGQGAKSDLTIKGSVIMRDASKPAGEQWGVTSADLHAGGGGNGADYQGARWQPAGIYLGQSFGSTITLDGSLMPTRTGGDSLGDGTIDIAVKGTAITTDPYYASPDILDESKLATITLKNANINIETPRDDHESFYSLANYGGTININAGSDAKETDNVNIVGNMISMSNATKKGGAVFYKSGIINVGLLTADSKWTGVVDNAGTDLAGEVNLTMKNGAQWIHEAVSPTNGLHVESMPFPSNSHYGTYDGITHINQLKASPDYRPSAMPRIFAKANIPMEINHFSGNAYIMYSHDNDGTKASDFAGGAVKIKAADPESDIIVATDTDGINLNDKTVVKKVFANLSKKLYYLGAIDGKDSNLKGEVNILEGLTSPALQSVYTGNIAFDQKTGQGKLDGDDDTAVEEGDVAPEDVVADHQNTFAFADDKITGNTDNDKVMMRTGITADGQTYTFTKDTTFTFGKDAQHASVVDLDPNLEHGVSLEGPDATLTFTGTGDQPMYAIGSKNLVNKDKAPLTINVKAVNISVKGLTKRQEAFHFKSETPEAMTDKREKVDINSDVTANVEGSMALGVYAYGNYDITFKKNVNFTIDGHDMGGDSDMIMGAHGLYASGIMGTEIPYAPTIKVLGKYTFTGNGNGLWANTAASTIDLQGDTVINVNNPNRMYSAAVAGLGKININYKEGTYGAPSTYGKEVQITGNITTDRSADYDYWKKSSNAKVKQSIVNVGLSTPTSFWKGVAFNKATVDSIKDGYEDQINLILSNGATWTNTLDKMSPLGKARTFRNGSAIHSFIGGNTAEQAGIIFQDQVKPITIDEYKGFVKVLYKHDANDASKILGGDFIIKKASQVGSFSNKSNSNVVLVTDSNGISLTDKSAVDKVFTALAGKLVYSNYANNERYLDGSVMIAEGLTSASETKAIGDILFNKADGRGYYATTVPEDPTNIPDHQIFSQISQSLAGTIAHDTQYKYAGIMKTKTLELGGGEEDDYPEYDFGKDTTITAAESFKTKDATGDEWHASVYRNTPVTDEDNADAYSTIMHMNNKNLSLIASSEGNLAGIAAFNGAKIAMDKAEIIDIKASHTGDNGQTVGIIASGDKSSISIKSDSLASSTKAVVNVEATDGNKSTTGIEADSKGSVEIEGKINLKVGPGGYGIHAKGGTVAIKSGGSIEANNGIAILNEADGDTRGTVKANMFGSGTYFTASAASSDFAVTGDVVTKKSDTYLGLAIADGARPTASTWHGAAITTDEGKLDLRLQNGGQWFNESTNPDLTESLVTSLNPGMKAEASRTGYIWQNSDKPIHIINYSGYTTVFYKNDASDPSKITGGNFIVDNVNGDATAHPVVTLVTDGSKVTKETMKTVMNALAGKLIWTNVDNSIDTTVAPDVSHIKYGLVGYVRLSEGLTTAARTLRMGNIGFYDTAADGHLKGQGYLKPVDPHQVINKSEYINEDRTVDTDVPVTIENNKRVAAMYTDMSYPKDNPMIVDLLGSNLTLNATGKTENGAVAATVALGPNQVLNVNNTDGKDNVLHLSAVNEDTRAAEAVDLHTYSALTVDAPVVIDKVATKGLAATGVQAFGEGSSAHFKKDLTITAISAEGQTSRSAEDKGNGMNVQGLNALGPSSSITVDGTFTAKDFKGVAVKSGDRDAKVSLQGVDIEVAKPADNKKVAYALVADKGSISVNGTTDNGTFTPGDKKVNIVGDVEVTSQEGTRVAEYSGGQLVANNFDSKLDLALTTKDSSWTGTDMYSKKLVDINKISPTNDGVVPESEYESLRNQETGGGYTRDYPGAFNLTVKNGAQWTNEVQNKAVDAQWAGPQVTTLQGGNTVHSAGIIVQKDSHPIAVDTLKGFARVAYDHKTETPTVFDGGDIIINHAADNAHLALVTTPDGVSDKIGEANGIDKVMEALANKVTYKDVVNAPTALAATVEIGEGLTSPKEVQQGIIQFKKEGADIGKGSFTYVDKNSIKKQNVEITDDGEAPAQPNVPANSTETVMMRGVKSAQNEMILLWHAEQNDLQKRMGDLHYATGREGVWGRIYGGKFDADSNRAPFDGSYKAVQVGVDKKVGNGGWRAGLAASYLNTDATNVVGGTAKGKMASVAVYGTKLGDRNDYIDVYAKLSRLTNNYHVVNDTQYTLDGEYKATALTLSAEYGRKFTRQDGLYFEPQLELTYGHIPGKTYQAISSYGNHDALTIEQSPFDALVARLGVGIGKSTDTTDVHARLSMYHQFGGSTNTVFSAVNQPTSAVSQDYSHTWYALSVGVNQKLNARSYMYTNLERTFGGDMHFNWRGDVGVRFNF